MALRPDIVLQRSINAALSSISNVTNDTDLTIPSSVNSTAVDAALIATRDGIGSGFRFKAWKNGTLFLSAQFSGSLVINNDRTITLPTTYTVETIADTTLSGVLVGRIESSNGFRYIEGTVGLSAADFVFASDVVEADGVSFGDIVLAFDIPVTSEQAFLVPVIQGGYRNNDSTYLRLYGPGTVNADALGNIVIGNYTGAENRAYFRFRAPASGNLTALRIYWAVGAGYALGNGGTITIEVFEDDGTSAHMPNLSSTKLSTGTYGPTLSSGAFTGGAAFNDSVSLTAAAPLVAGRLYHIGFRNTAASPGSNYISVNNSVTITHNGNGNRWLSPIDNGVIYSYRAASSSDPFVYEDWTVNTNASLHYRPIMQLTIGGTSYANHVYSAGNYTDNNGAGQPHIWTFTSGGTWREKFTTTSEMTFSGMSAQMSFSVAGSVNWALSNGSTTYASGTIAQPTANYGTQLNSGITNVKQTWYDQQFSAATPTLPAGTYYLTFTVGSGTVKVATQRQGSWAYTAAWDDSEAQAYVSSAWIDADDNDHTTAATQVNNWPVVLHRYTAATVNLGTASNGVWMQAATVPNITNAILLELASHNIYDVYYECGWPTPSQAGITNGSIPEGMQGLFPPTAAWIADVRSRMAAISPKFKLWAWFGTFSTGDDLTGHMNARVNLLDSNMRSTVINLLMGIVNLGFDGVADDTEDTQEITALSRMGQGTVLWNNEFAAAAHAAGKLFMAYLPANWTIFNTVQLPQITEPDYLYLAAPGNGDGNWGEQVAEFGAYAPKPIIFGVAAWTRGQTQASFDNLQTVYTSFANKIDGYGMYLYPDVSGYWDVWDTWRASHPIVE